MITQFIRRTTLIPGLGEVTIIPRRNYTAPSRNYLSPALATVRQRNRIDYEREKHGGLHIDFLARLSKAFGRDIKRLEQITRGEAEEILRTKQYY